jgi:type 1 fimbria pilin
MRSGRLQRTFSTGVLLAAAMLGFSVTAASAATMSTVKVDGQYRIVSTDCYFAAGKCHARFDIEQPGVVLSDLSDKYFHGKVNGDRVVVGEEFPKGTSEDSWIAVGTTSNGGKTVSRNFNDGTGGSGTFTMKMISP